MVRVHTWTKRGRGYFYALPEYKTLKTVYVFTDIGGKRMSVRCRDLITIEKEVAT